jgi:exopolyphosphatase / guanosine-5'-triphosphate,3'-diphosphate pyrophosphatase
VAEHKKNFRRTILKLGLKYQYNQKHAAFVEKASLKLFDALIEQHGFGEEEKLLLSHASLLHDIGSFISEKKHNRHTKYIIESDKLLDTYPEDKRLILALIAFNHRKKINKQTMLLQKKDRDIAIKLSAILRVADSLDFSNEKIEIKDISIQDSEVKISFKGVIPEKPAEKLILKKDLFIDVFNLNVTIII